jgi:hypothetical protein
MIEYGNCHYGDRCNYIHDESEIPPHFHMEMPLQMMYGMASSSQSSSIPSTSPPPSNKEVVDSVVQAIAEKATKHQDHQQFSRESSSRSMQSSQTYRDSKSAHSSGRSLLSTAAPGDVNGTTPAWTNTSSVGGSSTVFVGESRAVQLSDRSIGSLVSDRDQRSPGRTTTFSSFSGEFSPERVNAAGGRGSLTEVEGSSSYTIQPHGYVLNDATKHVVEDVVQEIVQRNHQQSPTYGIATNGMKPPPQIVHVHVHFNQTPSPRTSLEMKQTSPSPLDPLFGGGLGEGILRGRSLSTSEHRALGSTSALEPIIDGDELSVSSLRLNSL